MSLLLIPIPDLDFTIKLLSEKLRDILYSLLDWYENNYVGKVNRNMRGRRIAIFPPEIRNVHERVLNGKNRTNNYAETANRELKVEIGVNHSSLWSLILCLQRVQRVRDL